MLALGQEADRGAQPADRQLGRPGELGRGGEELCRGRVAGRRVALDVVRAYGRLRPARGECRVGAAVGGDPAAGRSEVVDAAAHERMAGAERRAVAADEIGADEDVELGEHVVTLGDRGDEGGVEGLVRHRGRFGDEPGLRVQPAELGGQGRRDPRQNDSRQRLRRGAGPPAAQLAQVERVAAALAVEVGRVGARADQLARRRFAERPEGEPHEAALALDRGQLARDGLRRMRAAVGQRDEHRRVRRPPEQERGELERGRVRPLQVVEHEHERRQLAEPRAHVAIHREPLLLEHFGGEQLGVVAERVLEDAEGQRALELGGRAPEHGRAGLAQAREQRRLADPRLARHLDDGRARLRERFAQRGSFGVSAHHGAHIDARGQVRPRALTRVRQRLASRLSPAASSRRVGAC